MKFSEARDKTVHVFVYMHTCVQVTWLTLTSAKIVFCAMHETKVNGIFITVEFSFEKQKKYYYCGRKQKVCVPVCKNRFLRDAYETKVSEAFITLE